MSLEICNFGKLEWRSHTEWRSPVPGAAGCFAKVYERPDGHKVILIRLDAGAEYPAFELPDGADYFVLEGTATLNGEAVAAGTYVRLHAGDVARASSAEGCTVFCLYPPAEARLVGDAQAGPDGRSPL